MPFYLILTVDLIYEYTIYTVCYNLYNIQCYCFLLTTYTYLDYDDGFVAINIYQNLLYILNMYSLLYTSVKLCIIHTYTFC